MYIYPSAHLWHHTADDSYRVKISLSAFWLDQLFYKIKFVANLAMFVGKLSPLCLYNTR